MSETNPSQVNVLANVFGKKVYFRALSLALCLALSPWTPLQAQEDEDEIEIILDGLVAPGSAVSAGEEDDDEIEIILDGLAATGQLSAATLRDVACHRQRADDHAETLPCASPVRSDAVVFGELLAVDAKSGTLSVSTDDDVFLLVVPEGRPGAEAWLWSWTSETDAWVQWLDVAGQPLATYEMAAGKRQGIPMNLSGGFYYLKVTAGSRVPGTYAWALQSGLPGTVR